mgnify:FL=1
MSRHPIIVETDSANLASLEKLKQDNNNRLYRMSLFLQPYPLVFQKIPGKKNVVADALSRRDYPPQSRDEAIEAIYPEHEYLSALSQPQHTIKPPQEPIFHEADLQPVNQETEDTSPWVSYEINYVFGQPVDGIELPPRQPEDQKIDSNPTQAVEVMALEDIGPEQKEDNDFKHIYNWLETQTLPDDPAVAKRTLLQAEQYVLSNQTLYHLYQNRARNLNKVQPVIQQLAVPAKYRQELLEGVHQSLCHANALRTYVSLRQKYSWPNMYRDCQHWVTTCDKCQYTKLPTHKQNLPVRTLLDGDFVNQRWMIDTAGEISPNSGPYKHVFLMVHDTTKFCLIIPVPDITAHTIAQAILERFLPVFGFPSVLHSDRGSSFCNTLMKLLAAGLGIRLEYVSVYRPQANSFVEIKNKQVWSCLKVLLDKEPERWAEVIGQAAYAINSTTMVQGTETSAYECMFGRPPFFPQDAMFLPKDTNVSTDVQRYLTDVTSRIDLIKQVAEENSREMQQRRSKKTDDSREFVKFPVGSLVWLKRAKKIPHISHKLVSPYHKELMVVTKASDYDTYHLKMVQSNKVLAHPVHASRLKKYIKRESTESAPEQQEDTSVTPQVETDPSDKDKDKTSAPAASQDARLTGSTGTATQPQSRLSKTTAKTTNYATRVVTQRRQQQIQQQPPNYSQADGWFPARIVTCRKRGPNREFLVDFGKNYKRLWCPEHDVTPALVQHFFSTHTLAGKKRKRPLAY